MNIYKRVQIPKTGEKYRSTINPLTKISNTTVKKRRTAGYARVSTDKDEQFTSYEAQIDYYTTNIIFIGSSGVGKTHLATAIGIEAASKRISTYFINFAVLMEKFKQAAKENRVEKVVKHYLKYTVLIIDEIGYLPVDKDAAFGFFQLIAARYEFRPTILTTNQPFSKWTDVFGDAVIANAIIDRLVHHCEVIKITGNSYRIKGRKIFDDSDD